MTCFHMPRTCVLLAAHAIMWFGVVAYDAISRRGDSRWKATCVTSTSVKVGIHSVVATTDGMIAHTG